MDFPSYLMSELPGWNFTMAGGARKARAAKEAKEEKGKGAKEAKALYKRPFKD